MDIGRSVVEGTGQRGGLGCARLVHVAIGVRCRLDLWGRPLWIAGHLPKACNPATSPPPGRARSLARVMLASESASEPRGGHR